MLSLISRNGIFPLVSRRSFSILSSFGLSKSSENNDKKQPLKQEEKEKSANQRAVEQFYSEPSDIPKESLKATQFGREWSCQLLRNKSFEDLHKLHYVLLKEKNALLTEQLSMSQLGKPMVRKTRLSSVDTSMRNIATVIAERNREYKKKNNIGKKNTEKIEKKNEKKQKKLVRKVRTVIGTVTLKRHEKPQTTATATQ
eukprot:comp13901_c0_seq1/m.19654 comp13901_c0_seq1/g.19654  ORF comp13901_c0_seq1/g.19654 comp13901_c0_seq1/m.19654 type:complete len:199 (-) comp13901_c0_seq1:27-623(-)